MKMTKNTLIKKHAGFTLIEMAVVVIISGFIFIPLMAVFLQKDMDERRTENVESNERIVNAINFFYKQNGRYPCPARQNISYGAPSFGQEDCTIPDSSGVKNGALPTQTLGLPFHQAINKYGWKHIYAVTRSLTDQSTFDNDNKIEVISQSGGTASAVKVPFILVNTGEDGKGSYSLYGVANILTCTSTSPRDQENCDGDERFVDAQTFMAVSPTDSGYYDDKLSYGVASAKGDLWAPVATSVTAGNKVPLMTKTFGNVGIGTSSPAARLEVSGDALIETAYNGDGGDIALQDNISVTNALTVGNVAQAGTQIKASQFCSGFYSGGTCHYHEIDADGNPCSSGAFKDLANDGALTCKTLSAACSPSDDGNIADTDGACCYRYQLAANGKCCNQSGKGIDPSGACVDVAAITPSEPEETTPSCTEGYDDRGDCCSISDGFCCPASTYESGGNCWAYWD